MRKNPIHEQAMRNTWATVRAHLLRQGKKSESRSVRDPSNWYCRYRGPGGLKCAVGCLIPDNLYHHTLEWGLAADQLPYDLTLAMYREQARHRRVMPAQVHLAAFRELLLELQIIHDAYPLYEWVAELNKVARERGLSCP